MDNEFSNWQKFWRYTKQTPTPLLDLDKIFTHQGMRRNDLSLSRKWMTVTPKSLMWVWIVIIFVLVYNFLAAVSTAIIWLIFAVVCGPLLLTMGCCYVMITTDRLSDKCILLYDRATTIKICSHRVLHYWAKNIAAIQGWKEVSFCFCPFCPFVFVTGFYKENEQLFLHLSLNH